MGMMSHAASFTYTQTLAGFLKFRMAGFFSFTRFQTFGRVFMCLCHGAMVSYQFLDVRLFLGTGCALCL
jgi:hypothetical protein